MPISDQQERWEVYADVGTKDIVRDWLEPRETLSEFFRTAVYGEIARRRRRERTAVYGEIARRRRREGREPAA